MKKLTNYFWNKLEAIFDKRKENKLKEKVKKEISVYIDVLDKIEKQKIVNYTCRHCVDQPSFNFSYYTDYVNHLVQKHNFEFEDAKKECLSFFIGKPNES